MKEIILKIEDDEYNEFLEYIEKYGSGKSFNEFIIELFRDEMQAQKDWAELEQNLEACGEDWVEWLEDRLKNAEDNKIEASDKFLS